MSLLLPSLFPVIPSTLDEPLLLLSPFLTAGPVFVLANIIVLAILVSSGSFTILEYPSFHSCLPRPLLQLLASKAEQRYPVSGDVSDQLLLHNSASCSAGQSPFVPGSSQSSLSQKSLSVAATQRLKCMPAFAQQPSEVWMAIPESKQSLATSTPIELLHRSKSDQIESEATARTSDLRRANTMHDIPVDPTAYCNGVSSPMISLDKSLITNGGLSDNDFQRKCEDFISNFHANLKKEALD